MATNIPQKHLWALKNAVAFIGVILLTGLIFYLIRPIAQIFFLFLRQYYLQYSYRALPIFLHEN